MTQPHPEQDPTLQLTRPDSTNLSPIASHVLPKQPSICTELSCTPDLLPTPFWGRH